MILLVDQALDWLALAAIAIAIAAILGAAAMRAHFAMLAFGAVAAIAAGAAALALGAPAVAIAIVVVACGFAFAMLTGTILLTTRAAKPRSIGARTIGAVFAVVITAALLWAAPDVSRQARALAEANAPTSEAIVLAVLVLVGALSVYGLLGLGERSAFASQSSKSPRTAFGNSGARRRREI